MSDRIRRVTEVRDEQDRLIAQACCVCFEFTKVEDLWTDQSGQTWDVCSQECAEKTGVTNPDSWEWLGMNR